MIINNSGIVESETEVKLKLINYSVAVEAVQRCGSLRTLQIKTIPIKSEPKN